MIKRLIFDLDNTLIMWRNEYVSAIDKSLKKFGINEEATYMSNLIDDYENYYDRYDKELLVEFINKNIESRVDMNFIDDFLYNIGFCGDVSDKIVDTLEYLYGKYDLVVLTNWFTTAQFNRLKSAGIDKYFSKIFGGEKVLKPNIQSFINACECFKPEECIMIGDDYDKDMIGAFNAGLHTLYFNYDMRDNVLSFDEFYNFTDLNDIL